MSHHNIHSVSAADALAKLKAGNADYLDAKTNPGDESPEIRIKTCNEGQFPYAIVITCSDSRVIPEDIFSAGIGELFTIRVAGNVIDNHELGSIEYAAGHLGTKLVVVLGHTHCGAVGAAISSDPDGFVKTITDQIKAAIGDEKDDYKAGCLNVKNSLRVIREKLNLKEDDELQVVGAMYHIDSGIVEFINESKQLVYKPAK